MAKKEKTRCKRIRGALHFSAVLLVVVLLTTIIPMRIGKGASLGDDEIAFVHEVTEPPVKGPVVDTLEFISTVDHDLPTNEIVVSPDVVEETLPQEEEIFYEPLYTEADAVALAKMAWGEALVTGSDTEIAATMWCVLNRYDSDDPYYRNCDTIESIVKQSGAFHGYSGYNPLDEHLLWLAYDVLERWNAEQYGETDVGRVLPREYTYFHGDGWHNHFRIEYQHNGQYYDWSLDSPYES